VTVRKDLDEQIVTPKYRLEVVACIWKLQPLAAPMSSQRYAALSGLTNSHLEDNASKASPAVSLPRSTGTFGGRSSPFASPALNNLSGGAVGTALQPPQPSQGAR